MSRLLPWNSAFQLHLEMGKIDKIPSHEFPTSVFLTPLVFESGDEMHRIITDFVRRFFRFEIECAKTAVAAARRIKLWVEIEGAPARKIDNP
jgi:hypothetical protein